MASSSWWTRFDIFHLSIDVLMMQEAVKHRPTFADAYLNQGHIYKVSVHELTIRSGDNICRRGFWSTDISFGFSRLWECLKRPLFAINVHSRLVQIIAWLMVSSVGYLQENISGVCFSYDILPVNNLRVYFANTSSFWNYILLGWEILHKFR